MERSRNSNADSKLSESIRQEITNQLRELKEQLNREMIEDIKAMRDELEKKITRYVDSKIQLARLELTKSVKQEVQNENKLQIVKVEPDKQMIHAMGQRIYDKVHTEIMAEINPKINSIARWVDYATEDGNMVVDQYRRAVERQSGAGAKAITDGRQDTQVISQNVRLFFGDEC